MLQQSVRNMDRDVQARELITRGEIFRNRKLRQVRKRLDFGGEEGTSGDNSPHSLAATMDPTMDQICDEHAKDLEEKYNFDFLEEKEKEGPLEWEKIEEQCGHQGVPDFYFRAPHKKRGEARRVSPELLGRGSSPKEQPSQSSALLSPKGGSSSSPNGSRSFRLPTTTPVTRQLFCGEESPHNTITSMASITPPSSTFSSRHSGLTTFTDSFLGVSNGQNGTDRIIHQPLAINGSKGNNVTDEHVTAEDDVSTNAIISYGVTEEASSTERYNSQGTSSNHWDSTSHTKDSGALVNIKEGVGLTAGEKTPPHPGISISSSEGSMVAEESHGEDMRDETPSTSGIADRKRTSSDLTDYYPEKKRNIDRVKRKVFDI